MKQIKENKSGWPRCRTKTIECREKDFIVRIANWSKDKDEPGYDVEIYVGGIYDWEESRVSKTKQDAISLLNQIERELHESSFAEATEDKERLTKNAKALEACALARIALYDRGAPIKMILENVMLSV